MVLLTKKSNKICAKKFYDIDPRCVPAELQACVKYRHVEKYTD